MRETWKRNDYYDQKLIAVDTERPLKVSPEAMAAARTIDQIREGRSA